MAIGATYGSGVRIGSHPAVVAGSVHGSWQQCNDDATSAANQSRYAPTTGITSANVHWILVPVTLATRVLVQARVVNAGSQTVTASTPTVAVVGAYKLQSTGQQTAGEIDPGTAPTSFRYARIDSANIADAGTAITWANTTPSNSNTLTDASFYYSQRPTTTGWDCVGASYVTVLVTGAITTNSGACFVDVLVIN